MQQNILKKLGKENSVLFAILALPMTITNTLTLENFNVQIVIMEKMKFTS